VIVDEAQHLANAASYRMRQEQLNQLKSIENRTGVSHVMYNQKSSPFRPSLRRCLRAAVSV
jgi:hypothetical protein